MLLAVDLGNTTTTLGLFRERDLVRHWQLSTRADQTADEWGIVLEVLLGRAGYRLGDVDGVAVACVVPPALGPLERFVRTDLHLEPLILGPGVHTGMPIHYESPKEVGADRIAAAVAAFETYGGPVVVVDFGTAITFDAIDGTGAYLGGAIAPGVTVAMEALFAHASKLPRVELARPSRVIGRNTVQSMQSGILFGTAGQVDGMVRRIWQELGRQARVIATGAQAALVAAESETIERVDPLLTLRGLEIIYRRNRPREHPSTGAPPPGGPAPGGAPAAGSGPGT